MKEQGFDLKQVSNIVSRAFVRMIFQEGFVHSDPHPGNLLIRKKQDGGMELVILDHGIYTQLSQKTRHAYTEFWRAILT
jgi:aarF domain-containing kinase